MPRKKPMEDDGGGSPEWMTTFSDLMTLLLVFFVLLYSFSVIDIAKFQAFMASFQGDGILQQSTEPFEAPDISPDERLDQNDFKQDNPVQEIYESVKRYIEENNLEKDLEIRYVERGIALEIKDRVLFETAKAELLPESKEILAGLAALFRDMEYDISVEGHTDNRPIHNSRYPDNWELSTARAVAVIRYFTGEEEGLLPEKFFAVGYGEYRPVAENDSFENMALNRRVVLVINTAVDGGRY